MRSKGFSKLSLKKKKRKKKSEEANGFLTDETSRKKKKKEMDEGTRVLKSLPGRRCAVNSRCRRGNARKKKGSLPPFFLSRYPYFNLPLPFLPVFPYENPA